jgi:hypothetical protein
MESGGWREKGVEVEYKYNSILYNDVWLFRADAVGVK